MRVSGEIWKKKDKEQSLPPTYSWGLEGFPFLFCVFFIQYLQNWNIWILYELFTLNYKKGCLEGFLIMVDLKYNLWIGHKVISNNLLKGF